MAWDHRFRRLEEGEIILASDDCQNDDGTWIKDGGQCAGTPAPSPHYTSHRVYRRAALASTPPADTWHERRTMLPDGDARKGGEG